MKVDSYGRLVHVPEYPNNANFPTDNTSMEIGNISSKGINVKQADASWNTPLPEPAWAECEEVWARAERVKKLENEIERAKTHIYNLRERVKILEITPLVPVEDHSPTWVEEELEAIKNMPNERTCKWCKWGEKLETRTGFNCHYYPDDIDVAGEHWCSKWEARQ
jgi:hypothetical protein